MQPSVLCASLSEASADETDTFQEPIETEETPAPTEPDASFTEEDMESAPPPVDYEQMAADDLATLKEKFQICRSYSHISQLQNPLRYAELRDLGLSPEEAFLATNHERLLSRAYDNRRHLRSAVPKEAGGAGMSASELRQARELFGGESDAYLASLYRRATGRG